MKKQTFDLDWEYTEASGMMAMVFAQWQPVHLPHDLSITKARSAGYPTAAAAAMPGAASSPIARNSRYPRTGAGRACNWSSKASI